MAKFRLGDFTKFFNEQVKHLENDIQLAVHKKASNKLAQMSAITLEKQMAAKGVRRAKSTGTHNLRLPKEKEKANKHGSMLDVYYKVWQSKDRAKSIVFAGQTSAAYKARFVNDGFQNHHWWGQATGINVKGKHFVEASHIIMRRELPKVIFKSISSFMQGRGKKKKTYTI